MSCDNRRVNAARHVAKLLEGQRNLATRPVELVLRLWVSSNSLLQPTELQGKRDQPLLGAIVQVALESLPFLLPRLDHASARAPQLVETSVQLRLQPAILERDRGPR